MDTLFRMRTTIVTEAERDAYMQNCMSNFPSLTPSLAMYCKTYYTTSLLRNRWNAILRYMGERTLQIRMSVNGEIECEGTRESIHKLFLFLTQQRWGALSAAENTPQPPTRSSPPPERHSS